MSIINEENYRVDKKLEIDKLLESPAIDFRKKEYDKLLNDLQANILKHHGKKYAEYRFLKFKDIDSAYEYITRLTSVLPSAKNQLEGKVKCNFNVFLTKAGYEYLRIPETIMPDEEAFKMGISNRTKLNKDGLGNAIDLELAHMIVFLAYNSKKEQETIEKELAVPSKDVELIHTQDGILANPLKKELHFKDGISNPKYFPGATSSKNNYINAAQISPLNLILQSDKGGDHQFSCGSYGTYLKFSIDERAMDILTNSIAEIITKNKKTKVSTKDKEKALALVLGRFNDGTPITLHKKPKRNPENNFNYKEFVKANRIDVVQTDELGSRCPFHAHIRKANPRTEGSDKYRITRRGTYYNNGKEKGLLFASFQNSLSKQFEYVLNNWILHDYSNMNSENYRPRLVKTEKDILFAQKGDTYQFSETWNANDKGNSEPKSISIAKALIQYEGGIYYYAPSISFLKKISMYIKSQPVVEKTIKHVPPPFLKGTQIFLNKEEEPINESGIKFLPNTSRKINPN